MSEKTFSLQRILGNKIYRYIDSDGNKGKIHHSKSKFTPLTCETANGKPYVTINGNCTYINNLEELDTINSALNNYKDSFKKLMKIPSKVMAESNPELYLKTIEAIREVLTSDINNMEVYAMLDYLVKKECRINKFASNNKKEQRDNVDNFNEIER